MNRRVVALEAVTARDEGRLDLSRLTDAELAELEQVCWRIETLVAGGLSREEAISVLPTVDLRFLASIRVIEGGDNG